MTSKTNAKLVVALTTVAILWGTTYLAIRIAVHSIPPWYVAGFRQVIASLILLVYLLVKGQLKWIGWKSFGRQFILAMLMIVVANGLTTVAEKTIPSGLTSLLAALTPLFVFIGSVLIGIQKPSFKGFIGVLLGFVGVAFIFRDGLQNLLDPNFKMGILYMGIALTGWATGTIYTKKYARQNNHIFLDLFYQFSFAALVQLLLAFFIYQEVNFENWSLNSILAVVYLGVFGSIVGYFCYSYALKRTSATQVSFTSYFNTVIALLLGWLVLNETLNLDLIIATVLIISGVYVTNYKKKEMA
jgi:drug/metabolite transporter (DMT)-like permease